MAKRASTMKQARASFSLKPSCCRRAMLGTKRRVRGASVGRPPARMRAPLSGGRLGSKREEVRAPIPTGSGGAGGPPGPMRLAADASILPEFAFSHIYETGEHELAAAGLPAGSRWAEKLGCQAQAKPREVVDAKAGYKVWGMKAGPGKAEVYAYPKCKDGRVVADVVRLDKGHTQGLESHVTEALVKVMVGAKGGKARAGS